MNSKKLKIILVFSVLGFQALAQIGSDGMWLFTNLLTNFDIMQPKFNFGVEKMINQESSLALSGSIYYYNWFYYEPALGYEIELSYKKRINTKWLYYSPGISFDHLNYTVDENSSNEKKINKYIGEANIKLGIKKFFNRTIFDFFLGTGLRLKDTLYEESFESIDQAKGHFTAKGQRDKEGIHFIPVLKLGFIIGLRLK
jgi:hypothetical protein